VLFNLVVRFVNYPLMWIIHETELLIKLVQGTSPEKESGI